MIVYRILRVLTDCRSLNESLETAIKCLWGKLGKEASIDRSCPFSLNLGKESKGRLICSLNCFLTKQASNFVSNEIKPPWDHRRNVPGLIDARERGDGRAHGPCDMDVITLCHEGPYSVTGSGKQWDNLQGTDSITTQLTTVTNDEKSDVSRLTVWEWQIESESFS